MTITPSRRSGRLQNRPNLLKEGLNSNGTDLGIKSGSASTDREEKQPHSKFESLSKGELQLYSPVCIDYAPEVTPNTNWDWRTLALTRVYRGHDENEESEFSTLPRSEFKYGVIFPLPPDHFLPPSTPSRPARGAASSVLVPESSVTPLMASPHFRLSASPIILSPQFTVPCSSTGPPLRCLVSTFREIDLNKVNHSTRSHFNPFSPEVGDVLQAIVRDHDETVYDANHAEVEDEKHDSMTCGCRRVLSEENIEDKNFEEALRLMTEDQDMFNVREDCKEVFLAGGVQYREYVLVDDKTLPLDLQEEPDDSDSDGLESGSDSDDEGPSLLPSTTPLSIDKHILDIQNGRQKRGRKRKAGPSAGVATEEKPIKRPRGRPRKALKVRGRNGAVGVEPGHLKNVPVRDHGRREPPKGARDVRAGVL